MIKLIVQGLKWRFNMVRAKSKIRAAAVKRNERLNQQIKVV